MPRDVAALMRACRVPGRHAIALGPGDCTPGPVQCTCSSRIELRPCLPCACAAVVHAHGVRTPRLALTGGLRRALGARAEVDAAAALLQRCRRVVAVVGAGISTGGGIPDFRSPGGVYDMVQGWSLGVGDPQLVCVHRPPAPFARRMILASATRFDSAFFRTDPRVFYAVCREMLRGTGPTKDHATGVAGDVEGTEGDAVTWSLARPTAAHRLLRALEQAGHLVRVYTQVRSFIPPAAPDSPTSRGGARYQNVDGLETAAGVGAVVHCHGHMRTATCLKVWWHACKCTDAYSH